MWSYERHKEHERQLAQSVSIPSCYLETNTVDAWRHRRMLECVLPLVKTWPDSKWVTIGDGNFGSDAFFLQTHGVEVTATSISSDTLEIARARGWIRKYAIENAEELDFPDDSVDFILCKESLHHFSRPLLGFYEMYRAAKNGIVLIEPIEGGTRLGSGLKAFAKRALRGDSGSQFEPCGNFLYRLSIREISKMLTALGHRRFAWKGINDFFHSRFAGASLAPLSTGALLTRLGIAAQDMLCQLRLLNFGLAAVICFKQEPTPQLMISLRREGFTIVDLPRNPYMKDLCRCA
jgi:SAM-dependent methyltransferase